MPEGGVKNNNIIFKTLFTQLDIKPIAIMYKLNTAILCLFVCLFVWVCFLKGGSIEPAFDFVKIHNLKMHSQSVLQHLGPVHIHTRKVKVNKNEFKVKFS